MEQSTFLNSGKNPIEGSSEKVQDKNWGKSAASFCHQVSALVADMFCNFCSIKITKLLITKQTLSLEKK